MQEISRGEVGSLHSERVYRWQIFRIESIFSSPPAAFGLPVQPRTRLAERPLPGFSAAGPLRRGLGPAALGDLRGQAAVLLKHLFGYPQKGLSRLLALSLLS